MFFSKPHSGCFLPLGALISVCDATLTSAAILVPLNPEERVRMFSLILMCFSGVLSLKSNPYLGDIIADMTGTGI